jgi:hypothetical protein
MLGYQGVTPSYREVTPDYPAATLSYQGVTPGYPAATLSRPGFGYLGIWFFYNKFTLSLFFYDRFTLYFHKS